MENLRHLPAIHQLQAHDRFSEMATMFHMSVGTLTDWLTAQVDVMRKKIINGELANELLDREKLMTLIFEQLDVKMKAFNQENLRSVINATGVVLHTNLGRVRLSKQAIKQIANIASAYSTLEYNVESGTRGSRHTIVEDYITHLTGAEAAMVVNNNAAAVFLVLKAIAAGREVIVSRGELIEIGGSFRISKIMGESQAELVAVGTTNKTHASDYEQAITENTALLMKVHKSNFKVVGFAKEMDTEELVTIARKHAIPI